MRKTWWLLAALIAAPVNAQIYQCTKDGTTSLQDTPCNGATTDRAAAIKRSMAGNAAAGATWPWDGLRYGMSVDDVQRNVSGASPIAGSRLHDGARESLSRKGIVVAGIPFEASYYFKDGKLSQINVNDPLMRKNDETLRNFERLVAELRARFGSEQRDVKNEKWGVSGEASWLVGRDRLWVSITPITGDTSQLNFGYNFSK